GAAERAYRLFITEVPREAGAPPGAVVMALRLNLPVFVTPEGAAAAPVWSMRRAAGGAVELVLENRGSAHIRLQRIELLAGPSAEPVATIEEPAYVLAGKERSWPLALSAAALGGPLEVRAETQLGGLEATVALSGG
ncbi:MAG: fimbrial biogenesis chaperone, partial [Geminicoccales bacterium]